MSHYESESHGHECQKITQQNDGSLLPEFQLSDTEKTKRWIMSFGKNAVVVESEFLNEDIVLKLYSLWVAYTEEPEKTPRRQ